MRAPARLTEALAQWLARAGEDAPLRATQRGEEIEVLRADGSELSEPEQRRVAGLLAAHAVDPLPPTPRKEPK